MMEPKISKIGFALCKVITEQFAIIEEGFSETGRVGIRTNLKFGPGFLQKRIICLTSFSFESDEKPFIVIEAGCHFQITEITWKQMFDKESDSLVVPKNFLVHLAMLTVGTTRGILHAKTEHTSFNNYLLPAINVSALIKKDAVFKFNQQKGS